VSLWSDVPTIFVTAAACPACRSGRPIIVRSEANGDSSVTRKAVCRVCGLRFKVVVESLPEFGNSQNDVAYDGAD
jgi:hypothetical protein